MTMANEKISIRFFNEHEVRAVWDEINSKWWFSVLDIVGVLNGQDDYEKNRNYWKYLKAKLKKEGHQLGSITTQFKLSAPDGKKRLSNVLDYEQVIELAKNFPNNKSATFIQWFTYSDETMTQSVTDSSPIKQLLKNALTDKINDREMFMKGIDYSYYYEEAE